MPITNTNSTSGLALTAYQGDAKTLLAFDLPQARTTNLAGFSIQVTPQGKPSYYLLNQLVLPANSANATVAGEPANSTANAPIQKFRWLHVPGSFHQGEDVYYGVYTYTVTPRYFKNQVLQTLDATLSSSVDIQVGPFVSGQVELGFTRGFVQSQGFVNHFGPNALFQPKGSTAIQTFLFNTGQQAGANAAGQTYTWLQEYQWSGYTARVKIFGILNELVADPTMSIDVYAYDLTEPDVINIFLQLAAQGRIRIILDNASLHHSTTKPTREDQVEVLFNKAAKAPAAILRGDFGRYSHDKIFIVYKNKTPLKVLTGSTNFSLSGMYVNANHVLVFNNPDLAALYSKVFNESWSDKATMAFSKSAFAQAPYPINQKGLPTMSITFSPHPAAFAASNLQTIADRISQETSSVLFAVMDVSTGGGPVLPALTNEHAQAKIFSYGISDSPGKGISLYRPGSGTGVLVTGKPGAENLPPPFNTEVTVGMDHEIHHKFIVCGFNKSNAVVWCGSSNLALGGEQANGDNLIRIDDTGIATVFAIEAMALVDHFDFRDAMAKGATVGVTAAAATAVGKGAAGKAAAKGAVASGKGAPAGKSASGGKTSAKAGKAVAGKTAVGKGAASGKAKVVAHAAPRKTAVKAAPAKGKKGGASSPKGGAATPKGGTAKPAPGAPVHTLNLYTDDSWTKVYYDPNDLRYKDRLLFSNQD